MSKPRRDTGRRASKPQPPAAPGSHRAAAVLSPARRRAFRLVLILLPLAVLGLIELGCRLAGFGGYPPVFVQVGDESGRTWYATNRRGTDTYFSIGRAAPGGGMRELQFASPKPNGTVRVVCLGESAIQGFPQPLPLTDGSFLEAMLRDVWHDDRSVEVLNLGATAVASFPVRQFLDPVLEKLEPDLVVLMVGNNEFYGAYGMESLPRVFRSPAGMRFVRGLRSLAVSQAAASVASRRAPTGAPLMERAGAGRPIGPDDARRHAATTSLKAHVSEMARRCVARRVPLILCTVPTNERGLAPIGADREDIASSARAHFQAGTARTEAGQHDAALEEYVQARDLDTMPWRATSAVQEIVRSAAGPGVVVCDLDAAFRAASPGGAIGWELLDDHVHMSLQGQALFARSILASMGELSGALHVDPAALVALEGWKAYAERLGHSRYSDYYAAHHVRRLFGIGFMRANNEPAYQRFESRCNELLAQMDDTDRAAIARWSDPALHGASERPLEAVVGVYRMRAGDYETAAQLLRVARASVPPLSLWRLELTWQLLGCNRRLREAPAPEDIEMCREILRIGEALQRHVGAENRDVQRYLGLAYNMAGDFAAAVPRLEAVVPQARGQDDWEVVAALADSYLQLGRRNDAIGVLQRAALDPGMATAATRMLSRLNAGPAN